MQDLLDKITAKKEEPENWRDTIKGTMDIRYQVYLTCCNDGYGGDVTQEGMPLMTYTEWLEGQ